MSMCKCAMKKRKSEKFVMIKKNCNEEGPKEEKRDWKNRPRLNLTLQIPESPNCKTINPPPSFRHPPAVLALVPTPLPHHAPSQDSPPSYPPPPPRPHQATNILEVYRAQLTNFFSNCRARMGLEAVGLGQVFYVLDYGSRKEREKKA